jgi:hypothetical protein
VNVNHLRTEKIRDKRKLSYTITPGARRYDSTKTVAANYNYVQIINQLIIKLWKRKEIISRSYISV